jgi:hypothetical protein
MGCDHGAGAKLQQFAQRLIRQVRYIVDDSEPVERFNQRDPIPGQGARAGVAAGVAGAFFPGQADDANAGAMEHLQIGFVADRVSALHEENRLGGGRLPIKLGRPVEDSQISSGILMSIPSQLIQRLGMGLIGRLIAGLVIIFWLAENCGADQTNSAVPKIGQANRGNPVLIRFLLARRQKHLPATKGIVG